jgi:hypothetical protein
VSTDVTTAEELLREIATDLMRVAIDERTRGLHLKALALKRVVMGWSRVPPSVESVSAMIDTLDALRVEVGALRGTSEVRLRSTFRPAAVAVDFRRRAKG